ncbi:MAG: zinc-ribbon domain-containing protein, partial [Polyangiaceae bacterium]|nr:zinc-ribbon domain-containing protein [Polyangiaceae bacterium]
MFEVECPSCQAGYQVDERRVPPGGMKMRCPKCGESFQVTSPGEAEPVLGAALGLGSGSRKPSVPPTSAAGQAGATEVAEPFPPASPTPPIKKTMLGVAPGSKPSDLELANLDEEDQSDPDELEADLSPSTQELELSDPAGVDDAATIDLPSITPEADAPSELDFSSLDEATLEDITLDDAPLDDEVGLPGQEFDLSSGDSSSLDSASLNDGEIGLPDLGAELPDLGGGLPDVAPGLPSPAGGLPSPAGDLPSLGAGLPDTTGELPTVHGQLPSTIPGPSDDLSALPSLIPGALGEPTAAGDGDSGQSLDSLSLGGPPAPPAPPRRSSADSGTGLDAVSATDVGGLGGTGFGEVDLDGDNGPLSEGASSAAGDEFDAFPTESAGGDNAGGGDGYGDVALEGGGAAFDLVDDVDDKRAEGASSDAAPQSLAAGTAQVERPKPSQKAVKAKGKKGLPSLSRRTRFIVLGAALFAGAGGALSLLPQVGPFGAYFIIDTLNADKYQASLNRDIDQARQRLAQDTAPELEGAFREVVRRRKSAPRYMPRLAYAAYLGFLRQLRFGEDAAGAKAKVLFDDIQRSGETNIEYFELAKFAQSLAQGVPNLVVSSGARRMTQSVDYAAIVGEAALMAKNVELAEKAWMAVLKDAASARAHFGLARVYQLKGESEKSAQEAGLAVEFNPQHADARILIAELYLSDRDRDEELVESLTPLTQKGSDASLGERVRALLLLGELHLLRARYPKAQEAFTLALQLNAGSAAAQLGLAESMFLSGRYSEALARFEAASKQAPDDLKASLGIVRAKLAIEALEDADVILEKLRGVHPKSTAVIYWSARAKESIGETDQAIELYRQAIELGDDIPELIEAYVALTRLLAQRGEEADADAILEEAAKRFPEHPEVSRALGELSASRGNYNQAIQHYDHALEIDPKNIGYIFQRGIALRQARRFDEATAAYDAVETESKDYPGLALERGNLYEASGRREEALAQYEGALAKAPDDIDLQLRVGCGRAQ